MTKFQSAALASGSTSRAGACAPPDSRWARRRTHRLPAFILGASGGDIPCMVLDTSSTGLSLELRDGGSADRLPDTFTVYIPIENVQFASKVVRRDGIQAGVQFTSPAQFVTKSPSRGLKKQPAPKKSLLSSLFGKYYQ